jgi:DNA mismatch repair protein MutL
MNPPSWVTGSSRVIYTPGWTGATTWSFPGTREGNGCIILAQHGAHERILYERLLENPRAGAVPLPTPVVARLPEGLAPEGLVPEAWSFEIELKALGFRLELFGEGAVRISAVPETVTDPEAALLAAPHAALHALAGGEELAKALACKVSTKFGESLSLEEMKILPGGWNSC